MVHYLFPVEKLPLVYSFRRYLVKRGRREPGGFHIPQLDIYIYIYKAVRTPSKMVSSMNRLSFPHVLRCPQNRIFFRLQIYCFFPFVAWERKNICSSPNLLIFPLRSFSCRLKCCKTVLSRWPPTRTVIGGQKTLKLGFQSRLYCKTWLKRCILLQKLIFSFEIIKILYKIWLNTECCLGNWCRSLKKWNLSSNCLRKWCLPKKTRETPGAC